MAANYTIADLERDLDSGPYAWPGGYPRFFIAADGEALSFEAVIENREIIEDAIDEEDGTDWQVVECAINWEDVNLICAHTEKPIESAYGEEA